METRSQTSTVTSDWLGQGKRLAPAVLTILLAAFFVWWPLKAFFIVGVFNWHIQTPGVVEGGLELVVLFLILLGGATLIKRRSLFYIVLAAPILLYLRRHHVDVPFFAGLFYFEAIFALGSLVTRRIYKEHADTARDYVQHFLTGFIFWVLCLLILSAFGFGTPDSLRWVCVGLGGLVLGLNNFQLVSVKLVRASWQWGKMERSILIFLAILVLYIFAKTNFPLDYDSVWYGLRGEYVLAAEHSFFDHLGLFHFVYYYPKLFELFLLPLSGLGDNSFIVAVTIFCYAVLLTVAYDFLRSIPLKRHYALFGAALIGSLPVVSNMAETAKPDIITTLFLLMAANFLWRGLRGNSQTALLFGVSSFLLALGGKLTSVPFGGLLLLGLLGASLWIRRTTKAASPPKHAAQRQDSRVLAWVCLVGALLVVMGVTYRTYLLTGFPLAGNSTLIQIFEKVGFELKYPVAAGHPHSVKWTHSRAFWMVLAEYLFAPTRLAHVVITWPGNVFVYLLCIVMATVQTYSRRFLLQWRHAVVYLPILVVAIYFAATYGNIPGGDGNYYMFPAVLATLLLYAMVMSRNDRPSKALLTGVAMLLVFQTFVGFVTAPGWHAGTRKWDLNFEVSPFHSQAERLLRVNGMYELDVHFKDNVTPGQCRALGLGDNAYLFRLSCRYQSALHIWPLNRAIFASLEAFMNFAAFAKINHLIVPRVQHNSVIQETYEALKTVPGVQVVEGTLYTMLDLRAVDNPFAYRETYRQRKPREVPVINFAQSFNRAALDGARPVRRSWGNTVSTARGQLLKYSGAPSLIIGSDAGLEYTVTLPDSVASTIRLQMGRPTEEIVLKRPGATLRIEVSEQDSEALIVQELIACPENFQEVAFSLEAAMGKTVRVRFRAEKSDAEYPREEWVLLIAPRIVHAVGSE